MSNFYLTFDTETSRVLSYQSSVFDEETLREMVQEANPTWDISSVEKSEALTAYMVLVDGTWEQRQKAAITATWDADTVTADGTSEIVLSGLPVPCTVYIDGNAVSVDDGSLEFSTDSIGYYKISIDEQAYLPIEWTINAI